MTTQPTTTTVTLHNGEQAEVIVDMGAARATVATGQDVTVAYESASRPGTFHAVRVEGTTRRVVSCTCEGWRHRRSCRHAKQAAKDMAPAQYKVIVRGDTRTKTLGPFTRAMAWHIAKGAQTKTSAHTITIAQLGGVMGGDRTVYTLERIGRGWDGYKPGERVKAMWADFDAHPAT